MRNVAETIKVMDYHEDELKFHRFVRWIQLPFVFVAMITLLVLHWEDYKTFMPLVPEAVLCVVGILFILMTEFGFIYNASYSYYTVQLNYFNYVIMCLYYLIYNYIYTSVSNAVIVAYAIAFIGTVMLFAFVSIYYLERKYLFVESREDKRIKNAGLKATKIDFNPKFEREKMSRGELKGHMEKRFEEVDNSIDKKKEEHKEADPFEDK